MSAVDTSDTTIVQELRSQLQDMAAENQTLRVGITQRDRWITELRSTVAALMGTTPYPSRIPGVRKVYIKD